MRKTETKFKKIIKHFTNSILVLSFLLLVVVGCFFITNIENTKVDLSNRTIVNQTKIYDRYHHEIELLGKEDDYVSYEQLPNVLIDALLSIEDNEYYYHNGFNPKRIILSLVQNLFSSSLQGGSTITQQLIKNTTLTNEKTYSRKIKEAYLSFILEQNYTKEEILELYFNKVYFEQSVPGINYASKTFFNKNIWNINLVEAATLVGLVKSPSYYYPFTYPERTNERKNLVLNSMYQNKAITYEEYQIAKNINVSEILYQKEQGDNLEYPFQAYLDLVYEEVKRISGKDLYTHPLKVETYLDTNLQNYIDQIQEGKVINFTDDNQQIGGAIIDNSNTSIIGIIGGRNYVGKKVFNRGFHLKRSPASTIKPLLSYSLGMEYLSLHPLSTVEDEEYNYQGTNTSVHNADKKYLGNISVIDALGYSRNTCAVKLFDQVVSKIGIKKVQEYLKSIDLMDEGVLTSSYAIGGMTYGLSPLQVCGGYSMLANHGRYQKPSTIKKITDYEGNVIYERKDSYKQIINEESADMVTYSLNKVIEKNYLNISVAKPNNIAIAGKTGTNAYDISTINKLDYPRNADKDIWFAGYNPNHTCVVWTGFDEAIYKKNYFTSNDPRKKVSKQIFKLIMERINQPTNFNYSSSLKEISLVKGLDDSYLPNEITPSIMIDKTLINPDKVNVKSLPSLNLETIDNVEAFTSLFDLVFQVKTKFSEDPIYERLLGKKQYVVMVTDPLGNKESFYSEDGYFEYFVKEKGEYLFEFSITFSNKSSLYSSPYIYRYFNNIL